MRINIATGRHRTAKRWANKEIEWADLVNRCRETHRTPETIVEYMSAPKSRRDEIKDVGAFVGGYLANGRRTRDSVLARQLITLDADYASPSLWEDFTTIFGSAAFCYSTHTHTAEKPRLRLVILADREMGPDEYEPVARKITGLLGIEQFDPTTYDIHRLMYWPSTARDGEYFFDEFDGPPVGVDALLGQYRNWRDSSEWPMSELERDRHRTGITKAGEPTEKPGAVGLFCRVYSISQAIEKFLPEVYEPAGKENRYTYVNGTTSAGLIVYDDKYSFSHHGTDPTSGKLCNAFDLVRIHLFGSLDEGINEETPINRRPSTAAMTDLAMRDSEVKKLSMAERLQQARDDFEGVTVDPESLDWMARLEMNKKGDIIPSYENIRLILENDPRLAGRFKLNQFSGRIDVVHPMPWSSKRGVAPIEDMDERGLREYLGSSPYNLTAPKVIDDVYPLVASKYEYHPVRDYLESLEWDGERRVDTLLTDYLGAVDTPLHRAYIRKWLCAAVRRIYYPGTKFDYVLTLIGPEGARKSTFFKSLGKLWFSESFTFNMLTGPNITRAYEAIQGKWIIEIPEMSGLRKTEVEAAKSFLSATEDYFRGAYLRHNELKKRQCVLAGTTNNRTPLIGQTGNRRYWTVDVDEVPRRKKIEGELIDADEVDQIWAEVMTIWDTEPLFLGDELEAEARAKQNAHTETDSREGIISRFLDLELPENWLEMAPYERRSYFEHGDPNNPPIPGNVRDRVCPTEIWVEALGGQVKDINTHSTRFIHDFLRRLPDWEPSGPTTFKHYGSQRAYRRKIDKSDLPF